MQPFLFTGLCMLMQWPSCAIRGDIRVRLQAEPRAAGHPQHVWQMQGPGGYLQQVQHALRGAHPGVERSRRSPTTVATDASSPHSRAAP